MTDTTATVGWEFKNGIYQACLATFTSDVLVSLGRPDDYEASAIVMVERAVVNENEATVGDSRQRDEDLTCEVVFSVTGAGMQAGQFDVESRAWGLVKQLEDHIHYIQSGVDNTTLGGAVLWCFLTRVEETATGVFDLGRAVELTATFTAFARIRAPF